MGGACSVSLGQSRAKAAMASPQARPAASFGPWFLEVV